MQFVDKENQSMVGMVVVIEAVVTEMLTPYLKSLSPADRAEAVARITAQVTANGKQIVGMAEKAQLSSAQKIQAAASRMVNVATTEALAGIAKT